MHNREYVLEIETHEIPRDFRMQTDRLHSTRWTDHRVKLKEGEKRDKYLNLARELKTL